MICFYFFVYFVVLAWNPENHVRDFILKFSNDNVPFIVAVVQKNIKRIRDWGDLETEDYGIH